MFKFNFNFHIGFPPARPGTSGPTKGRCRYEGGPDRDRPLRGPPPGGHRRSRKFADDVASRSQPESNSVMIYFHFTYDSFLQRCTPKRAEALNRN